MANLQNINITGQNYDFSGIEFSSLSQPYWNHIFHGGYRHLYSTRIEPDPSLQFYNLAFEPHGSSTFTGDIYMITSRRGDARPESAHFQIGGYFENDINFDFDLLTVYNTSRRFNITFVESFPGDTFTETGETPIRYDWVIYKFQFGYATTNNNQIINIMLDIKWSEEGYITNPRAASYFYN